MANAVLVVDDKETWLDTLRPGLEHEGFVVRWAKTKERALRYLRGSDAPQAAIVNLHLTDAPDCVGLRVLDAIRTGWPDLPRIAISSFLGDHGKRMLLKLLNHYQVDGVGDKSEPDFAVNVVDSVSRCVEARLESPDSSEDALLAEIERSGGVDVGVICALREEFRELYPQLPNPISLRHERSGVHDYAFRYPSVEATPYLCAATFVGNMGPTNAAVATERFLTRRKPKTIVMLGIAAGIDTRVKLGDVVVASQVDEVLNSAEAVPGESGSFEFRHGGQSFRCSGELASEAEHLEFAHSEIFRKWSDSCASDLRSSLGEDLQSLIEQRILRTEPELVKGAIASGPVVGAAGSFVDWLKTRNRNYLALEMEGGGMLSSVYGKADPERTMILRGISDLGDSRKTTFDRIAQGGIRRCAMNNAIRLLWGLMQAGMLPSKPMS